jgi:ribonucleoside-diphosphate reductase subunit M1
MNSEDMASKKVISIMEVIKRDGRHEKVSFDKIIARIDSVCKKLNLDRIDPIAVAKDTVQGLYDGITTEELDFFAANKCAERILDDCQYNNLAAGLCVSNLHKSTSSDFLTVTRKLYNNSDCFNNINPLVTKEYLQVVEQHINLINNTLDYDKDYYFDFFGIKTLERAYLIRLKYDNDANANANTNGNANKTNDKKKDTKNNEFVLRKKYGKVVERPQHLIMRTAIGIHGIDIISALETYQLISDQYFTHATPTLYNAGSYRPQLSSCFLLGMNDSLKDILDTVHDIGCISKWSGGIGLHLQDIRGRGSGIRGTNGNSDGIIPLIKLLNSLARYVNQGGRRNGSIAVYTEPWYTDIFEFCDLKKNTGAEELRARDIFLALWIPDLFMKRVKNGEMWSLMCPDECPGLTEAYGDKFEELYIKYENEGRFRRRVKAEDLWFHILSAQIETGMPYMCYKDNVNKKSNQQNIGTIKSSNLCAEIVEYSDQNEIAVCNLCSICLPKFIVTDNITGNKTIDYDKLCEVAQICTRNLNKIIDINFYPVDKAKVSNMKHRPIGVGIQGLADVYCILNLPFDSDEANAINKQIFETIYYGCLKASCDIAKRDGPYSTFVGSPFSKGLLQYHMWGLTESDLLTNDRYDWLALVEDIKKYGTRNSLLTAVMPTASTSQIMGNNEAMEPYTTNLYMRSTLAGEYIVVNKHLVEQLIKLGLWTKKIRQEFLYDNGSIQQIKEIPDNIKAIFKTAFEMKTKPIVDQAISRGPFVDQSQSLNIFSAEPDFDKLTSSHFYGWANGLKTGMYYLRSRPAVNPIQFGLDPNVIKKIQNKRKQLANSRPLVDNSRPLVDNSRPSVDNSYNSSDSDDNNNESIAPDPRRINEIEIANTHTYEPCDMCSG